jgi:hypothetical protein
MAAAAPPVEVADWEPTITTGTGWHGMMKTWPETWPNVEPLRKQDYVTVTLPSDFCEDGARWQADSARATTLVEGPSVEEPFQLDIALVGRGGPKPQYPTRWDDKSPGMEDGDNYACVREKKVVTSQGEKFLSFKISSRVRRGGKASDEQFVLSGVLCLEWAATTAEGRRVTQTRYYPVDLTVLPNRGRLPKRKAPEGDGREALQQANKRPRPDVVVVSDGISTVEAPLIVRLPVQSPPPLVAPSTLPPPIPVPPVPSLMYLYDSADEDGRVSPATPRLVDTTREDQMPLVRVLHHALDLARQAARQSSTDDQQRAVLVADRALRAALEQNLQKEVEIRLATEQRLEDQGRELDQIRRGLTEAHAHVSQLQVQNARLQHDYVQAQQRAAKCEKEKQQERQKLEDVIRRIKEHAVHTVAEWQRALAQATAGSKQLHEAHEAAKRLSETKEQELGRLRAQNMACAQALLTANATKRELQRALGEARATTSSAPPAPAEEPARAVNKWAAKAEQDKAPSNTQATPSSAPPAPAMTADASDIVFTVEDNDSAMSLEL